MKWNLLFLIVFLFNITIAQAPEDNNELPTDNTPIPESTQLSDSIPKAELLNDRLPKEWITGYTKGKLDGSKKNEIGWSACGFLGGAFCCIIGSGIIWLDARGSEDTVYHIPAGDKEYQAGYLKGYTESAKSRRGLYAFWGGLIGTTCFTVVMIYVLMNAPLWGELE